MEHFDLEDIMVLVSEAGYQGKITSPISYISTKPILHAEEDLEIEEDFRSWNL